jgi:hypothetical protein
LAGAARHAVGLAVPGLDGVVPGAAAQRVAARFAAELVFGLTA